MIRQLNAEKAREILRRGQVARLGCIVDREPYVVPVNYCYDGECAILHSLPGRKIDAMRENPRACLQVDEIEDDFGWMSVLAFGSYEELTNPVERASAINCLLSHFPRLTPVESLIAEDAAAPSPIVFRIRIDRITGVGEGWG